MNNFPVRSTLGSGFTLIELSIVLVIIGLIVGGVLVGTDLIKAASIRAQIAQIDSFRLAANTFQLKYDALPGDMTPNQAQQNGFASRAGSAGRGDGNGVLEGGGTGYVEEAGENVLFWNDLGTANMISGHYVGQDCAAVSGTCVATSSTVPTASVLPQTKIAGAGYVVAYSAARTNYFNMLPLIPGTGGINNNGDFDGTPDMGLTPAQCYSIDLKIDDGDPLQGRVTASGGFPTNNAPPLVYTPAAPAAGVCVSNATTPASYNVAGSYADILGCTIQIAF